MSIFYIAAYLIMQINKQKMHIYFLGFKFIQKPGDYIEVPYIIQIMIFYFLFFLFLQGARGGWRESFEVLILWLSTWKSCSPKTGNCDAMFIQSE